MPLPGSFGLGGYGTGPYGSAFLPFGVASALALNPNLVSITFSDPVDFSDPAVLLAGNYSVMLGLTVFSVAIESAQSVRLSTSIQSYVIYEAVVADARSTDGRSINPNLNRAFFTGFPAAPSYSSVGMTPTRVRLVFSAPMAMNAALSDPASYTLTDIHGAPIPLASVTVEQGAHPRSVILTLAPPTRMHTTEWYQTNLVGALLTEGGLSIVPTHAGFQFIQPDPSFEVDRARFTGEAHGGLLGSHNGLVFFSPALQATTANSIIQVDQVDVCTTAYDKYTPPAPPDPFPFFTWSPNGAKTVLGQPGVSLWAPFPRLAEARFELTFTGSHMVDPVPPAEDGPCTATLAEPWDHNFVALLNNPAWKLFDNTGLTSPPCFICAANTAPIPPGPMTTILLQAAPSHATLIADSSVTADLHYGSRAAIVAGSTLTAELSYQRTYFTGDSSVTADLGLRQPVDTLVQADSSVTSSLGQDFAIDAAITADSAMVPDPNLGVTYDVDAEMIGDSAFNAVLLPSGLRGYWPADGTALDITLNYYNLTPRVAPTPLYAAGMFGQAFDFTGNPDNQLTRPGLDAGLDLVGDFSISVWVYIRSAVGEMGFMGQLINGTAGWFLFSSWGNAILYGAGPGPFLFDGLGPLTPLAWHHLVVRRSGTTIDYFMDGALFGSNPGAGGSYQGGLPFTIGGRSDGISTLDGMVDDAAIFNGRVLTDPEIAFLWNGGAGNPVSALP